MVDVLQSFINWPGGAAGEDCTINHGQTNGRRRGITTLLSIMASG
jgi:hypothetical protein